MAYLRSRITLPHSTIHFSNGGLSDGAFVDSRGDWINTVHMGEFTGTEKAWLVGSRGRLVGGGDVEYVGRGENAGEEMRTRKVGALLLAKMVFFPRRSKVDRHTEAAFPSG